MSSLLDFELENTPEMSCVKAGEYLIRCKGAEVKDSKSGKPMLVIRFDIPSEATAYDLRHNIMLPTGEDEEKEKVRKLNRLKDVYESLGVALSEKDPQAFTGKECWAILDETDSPEYGPQNNIKKFIKKK